MTADINEFKAAVHQLLDLVGTAVTDAQALVAKLQAGEDFTAEVNAVQASAAALQKSHFDVAAELQPGNPVDTPPEQPAPETPAE